MIGQLKIDFSTGSKFNKEKLSGQNRRLYDWLASGKSIHCMSEAMKVLKIGYLNSRCSDLVNKHGININKKPVFIPDSEGNLTRVIEYSLNQFNN